MCRRVVQGMYTTIRVMRICMFFSNNLVSVYETGFVLRSLMAWGKKLLLSLSHVMVARLCRSARQEGILVVSSRSMQLSWWMRGKTYIFTKALPVVSAGEVEVAVEVEVVRWQFSHSHDGLLAGILDLMSLLLLLCFPDQSPLQTRNHLTLRVQVLTRRHRGLNVWPWDSGQLGLGVRYVRLKG